MVRYNTACLYIRVIVEFIKKRADSIAQKLERLGGSILQLGFIV
jgi:hypothetical protein